jgi:prepilin-type N-terminal cleavage/methylation domain-containing protein
MFSIAAARRQHRTNESGFTLVELLVVILIIGILSAIAVPMFLNQRDAAHNASQQSDMRQLTSAIKVLQTKKPTTVHDVTSDPWSFNECLRRNVLEQDPATLPRTNVCWVQYFTNLKAISTASGMNVDNLVDPYGRPYYLNPNELEQSQTDCRNDLVGYWSSTYTGTVPPTLITLPMVSTQCI